MGRHTNAKASRPLLITSDSALLDELLRLASIAEVEVDVAPDVVAARRGYQAASLVLLGADVITPGMRTRLPRRSSVVIVCTNADTADAWDCAYDIGAEHV